MFPSEFNVAATDMDTDDLANVLVYLVGKKFISAALLRLREIKKPRARRGLESAGF
jgi:hypothetical protein